MNKNKTAAVFPGQGTQKHGMGKDFFDNISKSRETYEEASCALGWDVADLCFGSDEKIHLTEFAQPCILTTEIAMFRGLASEYGFCPDYFGGHSLGEYTALVAADAMPFAEALQAVQIRGRLMQQATPPGIGAMAAVIADNLDLDMVRQSIEDLPMDVANINSADQVVISGKAESMKTAEERVLRKWADAVRFCTAASQRTVSQPIHEYHPGGICRCVKGVCRQTETGKRRKSNIQLYRWIPRKRRRPHY